MKGFTSMVFVITLWLLAHQAAAQMVGEFTGERGPVRISSQRLEADYQKKLITFIGDVVVRQKEFTLYADRLLLFIAEEGEEIDKILARGNVHMVQDDKEATCHEATYYHRKGIVVLQGEPVVREEDKAASASDEQRSVAVSEGKERVKITVIPREEK